MSSNFCLIVNTIEDEDQSIVNDSFLDKHYKTDIFIIIIDNNLSIIFIRISFPLPHHLRQLLLIIKITEIIDIK